jgi:integrase
MATFIQVKTKSGTRHQAIIRKKGHKPIKRTFSTKGQAKFWAQEQEGLIYSKRYKDPRLGEAVTLEQALNKYCEYKPVVSKKKPATLSREKYSKNNLLRLLGDDTPLSHIRNETVAEYQNQRLKEGGTNSSIRQEMSMLSKMYRIAKVDWGLPVDNPTEGIERVSPPPGGERFLSEKEAIYIIAEGENSRNKRFFPYILLLLHTGMRAGEVAKLRASKVDLDKRTILVTETKSGKPRKIPLTIRAADALKKLTTFPNGHYFLQEHHLENAKFMENPGNVFQTCWRGLRRRLEEKHQNKDGLEEYKDFPQIPYFKVHDLRHTAASHLLAAGVDIRIIADILGHSTLQMVMRYTHVFEETQTINIDKLNHLGFEETF